MIETVNAETKRLDTQVLDEILLGFLLTPMAFSNLRAPVRPVISVTDASEEGGAAGESSSFLPEVGTKVGIKADNLLMNISEEFCFSRTEIFDCRVCKVRLGTSLCSCPFNCQARLCSVACFRKHAVVCDYNTLPALKIALSDADALGNLTWELLCNQILPITGSPAFLKRSKMRTVFRFPQPFDIFPKR